MNKKYLAYIALLAGWLCFCYWLYAKGILPRLHEAAQYKNWPAYSEDLPYPLAFAWGSDIPLAGPGFAELEMQFQNPGSKDSLVIATGFYFRDEAVSLNRLQDLAKRRIRNAIKYLDIDEGKLVIDVLPQEINADVRAHPFEAIRFERLAINEVMQSEGDTLEICFPLRDSLILPKVCLDQIGQWAGSKKNEKYSLIHIVGTADGSGIAESTDMAFERAAWIGSEMKKIGWKEEQIHLSSGQRSHPLALRNRCVIVYFE